MGRMTFLVQLISKNMESIGMKDSGDFLFWSRARGAQEGEQREKGVVFWGKQRSLPSRLSRH